jgi:AcrR family transcriptional regulator
MRARKFPIPLYIQKGGEIMPEQNKDENFEKFNALDSSKQERILNAAMKEFTKGYKNALTDHIVKEAGISKGLLFHYFGTKERLYCFLIRHAIDTIKKGFADLVDVMQPDILESVWQLSVQKGKLSLRYPNIFDFAANAYIDTTAPSNELDLLRFGKIQENVIEQIYAHADYSLFRDDIDPQMAISIMMWTVEGFAHSLVNVPEGETLGTTPRENYRKYLEEFEEVIKVLRKCFYKKEEEE